MKMPLINKSLTLLVMIGMLLVTAQAHSQSDQPAEEQISQGQLEQILAPIALYPDTILSHILVAATYPLEVVQAERWTSRNPELKGAEAVEAVADKEWDPSVQALVAFPQILKRMSEDLDWTMQLGDAFLADEEQLLASVQILRTLASQAGSLDEMDNVEVIREDKTIIIEPREREVVYVPYYDTRVVYGPWRWQHYDPIFWDYPYYERRRHGSYYSHNRHSSFYWGPRVSLSFGFFFNSFHWQNRHLVRISSRHYRPSRYHNHHDILRHGYAQRWVHNSGRRHAYRNTRVGYRNNHNNQHDGDKVERGQREGAWAQGQTRQEHVRDRLATPRTERIVRRNARQNTFRNTRSNSRDSGLAQSTKPINNSRNVNRERPRAVQEVRRSTPRTVSRVVERERPVRQSQQGNRGSYGAQQRVATTETNRPARPASRPAPPQRQAQSKPNPARQASNAPRVDKPRSGPKRAQSSTRRERGHLR